MTKTIFSALTYCETRHEHEVRLITDGERAYAYGTASGSSADVTAISAEARAPGYLNFKGTCGQPIGSHDDTPCDGYVTWIAPHTEEWPEDREATDLLASYGTEVEW